MALFYVYGIRGDARHLRQPTFLGAQQAATETEARRKIRTVLPRGSRITEVTSAPKGRARTRSSFSCRWAEVRRREAAGHPMRHPRRYVFTGEE